MSGTRNSWFGNLEALIVLGLGFGCFWCPVSHTLDPLHTVAIMIVMGHAASILPQMPTEFLPFFASGLSLKPSQLAQPYLGVQRNWRPLGTAVNQWDWWLLHECTGLSHSLERQIWGVLYAAFRSSQENLAHIPHGVIQLNTFYCLSFLSCL